MKANEIFEEIKIKIEEDTLLTSWYGKIKSGADVVITAEDLNNYLMESNLVSLYKQALEDNYIIMPDETRLVRSLEGAKQQGWTEIYDLLKEHVDRNNEENGF